LWFLIQSSKLESGLANRVNERIERAIEFVASEFHRHESDPTVDHLTTKLVKLRPTIKRQAIWHTPVVGRHGRLLLD
jgi:hypothetical protein